jgi:hypothetical protein
MYPRVALQRFTPELLSPEMFDDLRPAEAAVESDESDGFCRFHFQASIASLMLYLFMVAPPGPMTV